GQLHKVANLVETVETANNRILDEKRNHASDRIDEKIAQLQAEILKSGIATPDLSNRLLRPLQLIKEELAVETGIAQIFMLQTQTAQEKLEDSLFELERAIQLEAEKQAKAQRDAQEDAGDYASKPTAAPSADSADKPAPVPMPKPVVEVSATKVFNTLASGIYLERQEDVDNFVNALKDELQTAIAAGKRVRLK
ncbi:MAG TPA: BREX system P-loop protein BrxC, partial [Marinobacter adhaerens]|nr:BREX system P-loop protein BrxC [Marinobacter adhaerens]